MESVSIKAWYGIEGQSQDVSDKFMAEYERVGIIRIRANNDLVGDVAPGKRKILNVTIECDGQTETHIIKEGKQFIWPKENRKDHLVVFYSHVDPRKDRRQGHFVSYCLKRLLDVVPDNVMVRGGLIHDYPSISHPNFANYEPIFREGNGHAMILQQVYRTLLAVRGDGYTPKYVSFAEHDALYPPEHFEFEDFKQDVLINENHIGFTRDGFQKNQTSVTWPTFAMTMKYEYAVEYFKNRLHYFMQDPAYYGLVEPHTEHHFNVLEDWTEMCKKGLACTHITRKTEAPILHLWNGKHTTSHYQTYPKDEYLSSAPYWGDADTLAKEYYAQWLPQIPGIPD